jgi:hypothetical protein
MAMACLAVTGEHILGCGRLGSGPCIADVRATVRGCACSFIDAGPGCRAALEWASSGLTIDPDPGKYPGAQIWRVECKRQSRCHAEFGN